MEYAKRTEELRSWNFEPEWIEAGNGLLDHPSIKKAAKDVTKYLLRIIELKIEREDVLGKGYHLEIGFLLSNTGSVSVHGDRKSRLMFRCEGGSAGRFDQHDMSSSAWAIYQLALPGILKKCKHISEYNVKLSYSPRLEAASVSFDFVLDENPIR